MTGTPPPTPRASHSLASIAMPLPAATVAASDIPAAEPAQALAVGDPVQVTVHTAANALPLGSWQEGRVADPESQQPDIAAGPQQANVMVSPAGPLTPVASQADDLAPIRLSDWLAAGPHDEGGLQPVILVSEWLNEVAAAGPINFTSHEVVKGFILPFLTPYEAFDFGATCKAFMHAGEAFCRISQGLRHPESLRLQEDKIKARIEALEGQKPTRQTKKEIRERRDQLALQMRLDNHGRNERAITAKILRSLTDPVNALVLRNGPGPRFAQYLLNLDTLRRTSEGEPGTNKAFIQVLRDLRELQMHTTANNLIAGLTGDHTDIQHVKGFLLPHIRTLTLTRASFAFAGRTFPAEHFSRERGKSWDAVFPPATSSSVRDPSIEYSHTVVHRYPLAGEEEVQTHTFRQVGGATSYQEHQFINLDGSCTTYRHRFFQVK